MMLNEPSVYACLGHALGVHAPGLTDLWRFGRVTHHLNLAQGAALRVLVLPNPAWRLGTTLNVHRGVPADGSEASAAMAERHNDLWNNCFLRAALSGASPTPDSSRIGTVCASRRPGNDPPNNRLLWDQPLFPWLHQRDSNGLSGFSISLRPLGGAPDSVSTGRSTHKSFATCCFGSMRHLSLPTDLHHRKRCLLRRHCVSDGKVHDARRIDFLDRYIQRCRKLKQRASTCADYFVWSLLDDLEWACGYRPTFGLVKVDLIACDDSKDLISGTPIYSATPENSAPQNGFSFGADLTIGTLWLLPSIE